MRFVVVPWRRARRGIIARVVGMILAAWRRSASVKRPAPLVRKVEQALRRLGAGRALVVAVSGGPDSVALLRALRDARGAGPLTAAHLNHQLRGEESDADEAFVRDLCAGLSLDCRRGRLDVRGAAEAEGAN